MQFQSATSETPRSGRGGRRFKSCHSDQYLADNQIAQATASATASRDEGRTSATEGRITADDILRAVGTAAEMECTPIADSALLKDAVLPVLGQAEEAFSAELVRINVEDLVQSAAELGSLAAE